MFQDVSEEQVKRMGVSTHPGFTLFELSNGSKMCLHSGIEVHMLLDAFFLDMPDCEDHVDTAAARSESTLRHF